MTHVLTVLRLFALALTLPMPWYEQGERPETRAQYEERVTTVVTGIHAQTIEGNPRTYGWTWGRENAALAVLAVFEDESGNLALEVHAGTTHPIFTSDDGRARCMGQLHVTGLVPRKDWENLAGTDRQSTERCALATIKVLGAMQGLCRLQNVKLTEDGLAQVFSAYGSGRGCAPTLVGQRKARLFMKLKSKVWALPVDEEKKLAQAE